MAVPQRMTAVTFGAHSVSLLRAFYRAIGWRENDGSDDSYASLTLGGVRLALYPIQQLHDEAAPGEPVVAADCWNGATITVNVVKRHEVDEGMATAAGAGATVVGAPADREWGGYSGYFADPEGHRWEIAWAPWLTDLE